MTKIQENKVKLLRNKIIKLLLEKGIVNTEYYEMFDVIRLDFINILNMQNAIKRKRKSPQVRAMVLRLYQTNMPIIEIVRRCDVSQTYIRELAKEQNLSRYDNDEWVGKQYKRRAAGAWVKK